MCLSVCVGSRYSAGKCGSCRYGRHCHGKISSSAQSGEEVNVFSFPNCYDNIIILFSMELYPSPSLQVNAPHIPQQESQEVCFCFTISCLVVLLFCSQGRDGPDELVVGQLLQGWMNHHHIICRVSERVASLCKTRCISK